MNRPQPGADVCLLLEGTYPYVFGGVSSWVHDLLRAQHELRFHLVSLMPRGVEPKPRFELPDNVVGLTRVALQDLPTGAATVAGGADLFRRLEAPLGRLQGGGGLAELDELTRCLAPHRAELGGRLLLDSRPAWEMLLRMYERGQAQNSFLDFFWSWRAMLGGLYSVLLAELPPARLYHTVSTGYAGLLAARAGLESGRPVLLTEHGIYTNERRIEIAMSDWLYERPADSLALPKSRRQLKDLWIDTFVSYSRICYEACSEIVTLYEENQQLQLQDGAPPERLRLIPNGIDCEIYEAIERDRGARPPTVALIGRVVPIKDVKTFLRACAMLRESVPELRALVLGPTDEDEEYFEECQELTRHLALGDVVSFEGKVRIPDYLGRIDAVVLTSISEAQPLVILEAGAAGVPTVATDVGACRGMLLGQEDESPPLGPGGAVTPLANPAATAAALRRLLTDPEWRERCGRAIRERVRRHYHKRDVDRAYAELYRRYREAPSAAPQLREAG